MSEAPIHFTEPTTNYWQEILPSTSKTSPPYQYAYPATLPDSQILMLPIRPTTNPEEAVASLLTTHASLAVEDQLGQYLADIVRAYDPEVIVGLPTLGLSLARTVAKALGHSKLAPFPLSLYLVTFYEGEHADGGEGKARYIPLGYSRKFWYKDELSTEVSSVTSPNHSKKIYLDPNSVSLLRGKKAFIIDDAISSGRTLKMSWDLLGSEAVGCEVLGAGVVMKQGERWREILGKEIEGKLIWVFDSPLLKRVEGGWDIRE